MATLMDRIKSSSSPSIIREGRNLFGRNCVTLLSRNEPNCIEADVLDGETFAVIYFVLRHAKRWEISADCDCTDVERLGTPCKHIWATVMAAEARGKLADAPTDIRLELTEIEESGDIDDDSDDEFEDDEDDLPFDEADRPSFLRLIGIGTAIQKGFAAGSNGKPVPAAVSNASSWQRLIQSLAEQSVSRNPVDARSKLAIEPVYLLDLAEASQRGHMEIEILHRALTPTGKLGKLKSLSLTSDMIPRLPTELDRRICLMLVGASVAESWSSNYYSYGGYGYYRSMSERTSRFSVPREAREEIVGLLAETGRFFVRKDRHADMRPLQIDRAAAWEAALVIRPTEKKKEFEIAPVFRRDGVHRDVSDATLVFEGDPGYAVMGDSLHRVRSNASALWKAGAFTTARGRVTDREKPALLKAFSEARNMPPIEWPAAWGIATIADLPPKPVLELKLGNEGDTRASRYALARVVMDYDGRRVAPDAGGSILIDSERERQIARHCDAERGHLRRLYELGAEDSTYDGLRVFTSRVPTLVLTLLNEGWEVTGNRALFRKAGDFSIETTSGIDWFEMNGGVNYEGQQIELPELLAAFRRGEKFVKLGDGSMGMLPEEWLARHGAMLELGQSKGDSIRFARTQISVLDALLAEMPEASFDDSIAQAREKLKCFSGVAARSPSADFVGQLRPYQEQGLGWLGFLGDFGWGGCLADDMGLGKTVQVLAHLAEVHDGRKSLPSLVVMPKSLVFNWMREAERFAPKLRVLDYTGIERKNIAPSLAEFDLVLTTYGTLRRDAEQLCKLEFNHVILDEAQAIKNPTSLSAKAVRLLRGQHRLAMTGTPVENTLNDLWSIIEFLNPGMLGSWSGFKSGFLTRNGDGASDRLGLLHRMMRPFILRRTKEVVAPELPQRSEQILDCVMSPSQKKYYDQMRDYYRASLLGRVEKDGLAKSKVYVLEALLRLRQAACHPALVDPQKKNAESAKLEMLLPMLEELTAEGHKALVFSQFTSMLALVREPLDKKKVVYEYLDGSTNDRKQRVDRFQSDENCRLFLISLKAGGVGLNLTAADYVFILDPWWNPAVEAQAIDRTHRIGQDKHVIAYRLITKDTVESRILELQQSKRDLAGAIVTEANSLISQLSREDLALLLG